MTSRGTTHTGAHTAKHKEEASQASSLPTLPTLPCRGTLSFSRAPTLPRPYCHVPQPFHPPPPQPYHALALRGHPALLRSLWSSDLSVGTCMRRSQLQARYLSDSSPTHSPSVILPTSAPRGCLASPLGALKGRRGRGGGQTRHQDRINVNVGGGGEGDGWCTARRVTVYPLARAAGSGFPKSKVPLHHGLVVHVHCALQDHVEATTR
jgi:hypothetical protein